MFEDMPHRDVLEGDVLGSMDFSHFAKSASLKSHKVLPRRKVDLNNESAFWGTRNMQDQSSSAIEVEDESTGRDSLTSSIQTDPLFPQPLPLTPPPAAREGVARSAIVRADSNTLPSLPLISPGLSTPIGQRSPPTPENTPPAKQIHKDKLSPSQTFHQGPSRAESFKTAREDFSSDDEGGSHTPVIKHTHLRHNWTEGLDLGLSRKVGLGLGFELHDEDKTPTAQTPRIIPETWSFNAFDGAWTSGIETVKEDPVIASAPIPMSPIDTRQHIDQHNQTPPVLPSAPASPASQADLPLGRELSLRDRIEKKRNSPGSLSTDHFAEKIQWPMDIDQADIDAKVRQIDNKRLSQMSATSTIVEAMVLETPPKLRRTLRRTGKNASLRTASSPISGSNRSSLTSDETRHRLVHQNTKITERGNRTSLTLDSLPSTNSDLIMSRNQPLPAPGIPQRHSSLRSSATNSKRYSAINSSSIAAAYASRPTTAPTAATSYFDIPRRQIRTMSGSLESPTLSKLQNMMLKDPPLVIPARSSSLSAPTSRVASRAASISSTGYRKQEAEQITQCSGPPLPLIDVVTRPSTPSEQGHDVMTDIKDPSSFRPRSALVTPFSMASMNSSTPGTLEVSEATAVNIYQHNNRSILLVQQLARFNSDGHEASIIVPEITNFTPTTPINVTSDTPPRSADSPLRHPRAPPQPPNFQVIPPTPAERIPMMEADRQLGRSNPDAVSTGRFAKVRRALSARRYSESFVSPLRSLSKRHTITASRRITAAEPDSKLSPFWRPRGFWDDVSDGEGEFDNDDHLATNVVHTPKRTTSGPSAISRRFGSLNLRRRPQAETFQSVRRTFSDESIHSYAFITTGKRLSSIPRLGYQIHSVGFKGLQDMYEKRKVRKEEERREKERVRLRRSIGPVVVQEDGYFYRFHADYDAVGGP